MSISSGAVGSAFEVEETIDALDVARLSLECDLPEYFDTSVDDLDVLGAIEELEVLDSIDSVGAGDVVLAVEGLLDARGVGGSMNAVGSWTGDCDGTKLRFELPISFGHEIGRPTIELLRTRLRNCRRILI